MLVSIPYATALTLVVLEDTANSCPADSTKPVRSNTAFAGIVVPYSIHSAAPGLAEVATATLTVTEDAFLLHIVTLTTAKYPVGQVYTVCVVPMVPAKSDVPNLPVAAGMLNLRLS